MISSRFLTYIWFTCRYKLLRALAVSVCVSLTEGLALLIFLPLFSALGVAFDSGQTALVAQTFATSLAAIGIPLTLPSILACFFLVMIVHESMYYMRGNFIEQLVQDLQVTLRERAYAAAVWSNWRTHQTLGTGEHLNMLTGQIDEIGRGMKTLLSVFVNLCIGFVYVVFALWVSAKLTLLTLACSGYMLWRVWRRYYAADRIGRAVVSSQAELYNISQEHHVAAKTSRLYGLQEANITLFAQAVRRIQVNRLDGMRVAMLGNLTFKLGSAALLCGILYAAIEQFHVPPADLLFLILLFARLMPKLSGSLNEFLLFAQQVPTFQAVMQSIEHLEHARERPECTPHSVKLEATLACQQVTYSHSQALPPSLKSVSLSIGAGERVVIVGQSGSGKTTLLDILLGLLTPASGEVLLDGKPRNTAEIAAWRSEIGYVGQETFLFDASVRQNMRWACSAATDAEIWQALERAAAADFVKALPLALDTHIGERGIRLSGGQRQRIAIARAYLRNPRVLVLDEATNELDMETERQVFLHLQSLRGKTTVIIVSHRLSALEGADRILLLRAGEIKDLGPYQPELHTELWAS